MAALRMRRRWGAWLASWLSPVLLAALWEAWIAIDGLDPIVAPHVWDIAISVARRPALFGMAALSTLMTALAGLGLGALGGIGLAVTSRLARPLAALAAATALVATTIPVVAFIPIVARIAGYGWVSELVIVAVICFFPFFVFVSDALLQAPASALDLMTVLGAGRAAVFHHLLLRSSLPGWAAALKVAAPASLLAATTAEYLMGAGGLGGLMRDAIYRFDLVAALGASAVTAALSLAGFSLAVWIERQVLDHCA